MSSKLEDEPWYNYRLLLQYATKTDRREAYSVGSIFPVYLPNKGGDSVMVVCSTLVVTEDTDPENRYRFFASKEEAEHCRVIRGLPIPVYRRVKQMHGMNVMRPTNVVKVTGVI